jgi:hypothetical protein
MKQFQQVSALLKIVVAAIMILLKDNFESLLQGSRIEDYHLIPFLLVAALGMMIADNLASIIISNLRILRRVLAGNDDIEGEWMNVVFDSGNRKQIRLVEFCVIYFDGEHYAISGDTWDLDGDYKGDFTCRAATYSNRELVFTYHVSSGAESESTSSISSADGYGIIKFIPHDKLPEQFYGHYSDDTSVNRTNPIRAKRLSGSKNLSFEERREQALAFAKKYCTGELVF